MKIIIAEKVNKEILQWQSWQSERTKIITWTSDINYHVGINEINIYDFIRNLDMGININELPWIEYHVLNYRSVQGSHQLEFKDFNGNIVSKVYFDAKTHKVIRTDTLDNSGQNISVEYYAKGRVTQRVDYDDNQHPLTSQFIGIDKNIKLYWQSKSGRLINTGMSLVQGEHKKFYNTYWEWYFVEFKNIINSFENVSEIISYASPILNIDLPNKKVMPSDLYSNYAVSKFNNTRKSTKWIVQFESKNYWKPRTDVAHVAEKLRYRLVNFDVPYIDEKHWFENQLVKHFRYIRAGDLVIWQYPKYSPTLELIMVNWLHERGVIVVSFIHDLTLIREQTENREHYNYEDDKQLLSQFDANIIPLKFVKPLNSIAHVGLKNVVSLAPYDFIISETVEPSEYGQNIFYAGSLSKFPNLQNINFSLTVFGEKNFSNIKITNKHIHDGGFFTAELLVKELNNGYGLIWDEDEKNEYLQRYTQWNWPYKFSLYMASGLPVIAWEKSAIAEVIKSENIGIVVDSLSSISNTISNITPADFNIMAQNAARFGNELAQGKSTKTALKALENKLTMINDDL